MTWKIEPHDNYMCDTTVLPIQIVDENGDTVACNTDFYPTAITAEHAEIIVSAVNEVASLREQLATATAKISALEDKVDQLGYSHEEAMATVRGEI